MPLNLVLGAFVEFFPKSPTCFSIVGSTLYLSKVDHQNYFCTIECSLVLWALVMK